MLNLDNNEMGQDLYDRLDAIILEAEAGNELVKVTATANRDVLGITIDPSLLKPEAVEQLEDLILVALERVFEKAESELDEISGDMMEAMFGDFSQEDMDAFMDELGGGKEEEEDPDLLS